ncbi:MAG: COX15/CtaA family protein [Gaiellaceae bacterium]
MPSLRFRLVTLAAALAAWALVAVGGVVRVTESGLGCPDWPLCHGNVVPTEQQAPVIEYSHRAAATVVTLLVFATAIWAFRAYRSRRDVLLPALAAAGLVPIQALLGAVVVWLELPSWIVAVHFVVGMVFLAAAVVTAARAWWRPVVATQAFVRTAWLGAAAALVLVSVGAAVVAAGADNACGREWPACNGTFVAGGNLASLQVVHRTLAYVVAAIALGLAALARRRAAPWIAGVLPLAAVLAQIAFGVSIVLTEDGTHARRVFEMLHVAGAGAVWATLVAVAAFLGLPRRRESVASRSAAIHAA